MIHKLTEDEYIALTEGYVGLCDNCGEEQGSCVEPDAERYLCEACGRREVYGVEQLLLLGQVEITEVNS